MGLNFREMLPAMFGGRSKKRPMRVDEALDYLVQEEEHKLIDMDQVTRLALERVESSGIIFLDEIDKIAGREGRPWTGCEPRRRAARHPADCGRHDGQYAARLCENGSHSVHRGGRISRIEAERHDSRIAGPVSDPRGTEIADGGGFCAHPERAEERACEAIHGAARDRRDQAHHHRRCAGRSGEICGAGERKRGKYRRAAAAHDHGKAAGGDFVRRSGSAEEEREGGCGLCAQATGRHRKRSGSEPLYSLMRAVICLGLVAMAAVLAGCGYAGEPKPPALKRPMRVTGLAAVERGTKLVVTFTLPQETTEGLEIEGNNEVEMRVGVLPAPWDQEAWQRNSERVLVPGVPVSLLKPVKKTKSRGKSTSNKKVAPPRKGAPLQVLDKSILDRTVEIDASKYVGKSIGIGVLVHGPTGRDDGWSIVTLDVLPVLPAPRDLVATDTRDAVHLQWSGEAPAFRIFRRQGAGDGDWVQIGESTQPSFDDKAVEYGKTRQYYVLAVRKAGDKWMESYPSETITWTPVDKFPPAVPAGLAVISGAKTIELSWDRVTDGDLAGYRVYRNGVRIADGLQTNSYSDKDVVAGTKYGYQVSAVDQAGNESARSGVQEVVME